MPSFVLVTVLTSSRRVFILTNPQNFFTLQLAFTTSSSCSGEDTRLFLTNSFSISTLNSVIGGKGFDSLRDILVRIGTNKEELRLHPRTSSKFASAWISPSPPLNRPRMSSHWSHSSARPLTSKGSPLRGSSARVGKPLPLDLELLRTMAWSTANFKLLKIENGFRVRCRKTNIQQTAHRSQWNRILSTCRFRGQLI